ncbi:MAG: hypothetical protein BGO37_08545 [Cellulomonas sp. 73-92]|uniref:hypothetical protein n=1 Tax=Cellulomonas sp. 73-92 TaxID=1895740 RepID=UPI00092A34DE|nr:hypothetical protein [Cellulomonas sp. 73-92]OJV84455.1 MAG: hypothetical protein BGO37_08545 [Cellulomonas sp. 73-92]
MPSILEYIISAKDDASKTFEHVAAAAEKQTSTWSKLGAGAKVALAGAGLAVLDLAKHSAEAAEADEVANKRIEQINTSMGLFGSSTDEVSRRIESYAEKVARATGVDNGQIKATQAKLLTFKDLASSADEVGGNFDRATKAAVDLAAAGFGSATDNAAQLGKALQDPVNGLTALRRVGVTFTDQERAQIKAMYEAGDAAGAQNLLLKAIETQVGGTAEATATASSKMHEAWGQLQEKIGAGLLPALNGLANAGNKVTTWLMDTPGAMPAVGIGLAAITLGLTAAKLATIEWSASLFANPIVWIAAAAAAAIVGLILVVKNWGAISAWLKNAWAVVADWFGGVWERLKSGASAVWGVLKTVFGWTPLGFVVEHFGAVIAFFESIPDRVRAGLATVGDAITAPFRSGFGAIAHLWNSTVGRLSVHIPALHLDFSVPTIPGYATGTPSAAAGWAMVGENGPELVRMRGGEQVLTARQTASVGGTIRLHPDDMRTIARLIGQESADAVYAGAGAVIAGAQRSAANTSQTRGRVW